MNNLASIEKITKIYPHNNADALECAEVCNCQVIVPKGKHKEGDTIIFIWPDSILPDEPWAEFYKAKSSRVRAIKLRGVFSFGVIETFDKVGYTGEIEIGKEISEELGIKKFEPPPPKDLQAKGNLPYGIPKTDEENHYKFNNLPYGELCTVTRKIDGCLSDDTIIITEDGYMTIKDIVETKYNKKVLSYDIENKQPVFCSIVNHMVRKNLNNWYKIIMDSGEELIITGNHRIWVDNLNCYRSVEDLVGDEIFLTKK
jgi:RNA ligase (TIGR02306 family)